MRIADFRTMGCAARAVVDAEDASARAAVDGIAAWFAARERVLSRFDAESALCRLNASGTAARVDDLLWDAIEIAVRAAAESEGVVTPTVLLALERAGYDGSFDELCREQPGTLAESEPVADWTSIARDAMSRRVALPRGLRLDLAGTAKSWSADCAASRLARFGASLVEVGGDVAMAGTARRPWPIAVEDPRGGEPLDILMLRGGGVATSGRDHRRWRRSGVEQHHLIDPRTGAPARTDVISATVIARTALEADVAAKRILIEGSEWALPWIESRGLAAILVTDEGRVLRSHRVARFQWRRAA